MAGILKVDDLRGNTSAGDITITDGSTTSSLQSGLVKAWGSANQGAIRGSGFNFSSVTDQQTGDNQFNFTTGFSNSDYGAGTTAYGPSGGGQMGATSLRSITTSLIRVVCFDEQKNTNGRHDTAWVGVTVSGDLA